MTMRLKKAENAYTMGTNRYLALSEVPGNITSKNIGKKRYALNSLNDINVWKYLKNQDR